MASNGSALATMDFPRNSNNVGMREGDCLPAVLRITYSNINGEHECLAVLGSVSAIGCWEQRRAVRACRLDNNVWEVTVMLPRNVTINWKWVVVNQISNAVLRWETGGNRTLFLTNTGISVHALWNRFENSFRGGSGSLSREISDVSMSTELSDVLPVLPGPTENRLRNLEAKTDHLSQRQEETSRQLNYEVQCLRDEISTQTCTCTLHASTQSRRLCPLQTRLKVNCDSTELEGQENFWNLPTGNVPNQLKSPDPELMDSSELDMPGIFDELLDSKPGSGGETCSPLKYLLSKEKMKCDTDSGTESRLKKALWVVPALILCTVAAIIGYKKVFHK